MKRKLLLMTTVLLSAYAATAQTVQEEPRKWDATIERRLNGSDAINLRSVKSKKATPVATDERMSVIIKCTDSRVLADSIRRAGYAATVITPTVVTARIPVQYVPVVAKQKNLRFIRSTRRHRPTMSEARPAVKADSVQAGYGLETPYTGKNVIVAVMDQGFEYRHIAFQDSADNSRVIALWDRSDENVVTSPVFTGIPDSGDASESGGHASHVTNIAAGSKISENSYYGMAPEADIVMIPSTFDDAEILEDLAFIDSIATAQGKPWVGNMSFGSQIGPHDGTSDYDQAADYIIKSGAGKVLVAAMGNDGDQSLHAAHTFAAANDTVRLLVKPGDESIVYFCLYGTATDSLSHLSFKPYVVVDGKKRSIMTTLARKYSDSDIGIDPNNKKEYMLYMAYVDQLYSSGSDFKWMLEVSGGAGDGFHAWVNEGYGEFYASTAFNNVVTPDADYNVGEGAAVIPGALAVGAFNSAVSFKSIDGHTYTFGSDPGENGDICDFSSHGPYLGAEAKPLVVAPGAVIKSAVSKYEKGFDSSDATLVADVQRGTSHYYYGAMMGTSMASPAVAGIVALWLQANPNLTAEEIAGIIQETSTLDSYTGSEAWTKLRGYGKINAYAGLKKALTLLNGSVNGIDAVYGAAEPVTIEKTPEAWRLLFGSYEISATVQLYTVSGRQVLTRSLRDVRPGTEVEVGFGHLPAGVYVLRIATTAGTVSRKVMVQ